MSHRVYQNTFSTTEFYCFAVFRPKAETLWEEEITYREKLNALPLNSILDGGEGEKECRRLGEEIFNYFKQQRPYDPNAGKVGMHKIINNLDYERARLICDAWNKDR